MWNRRLWLSNKEDERNGLEDRKRHKRGDILDVLGPWKTDQSRGCLRLLSQSLVRRSTLHLSIEQMDSTGSVEKKISFLIILGSLKLELY